MTEQDALDAAAKAAGYKDWRAVKSAWMGGHLFRETIRNHANEILARQASDKALADFRKEVSEAVKAFRADWQHVTPARDQFDTMLGRFIIPAPDPLVEALSEAMCGIPGEDYTQSAEDLRTALAKHGLKLERIDQ